MPISIQITEPRGTPSPVVFSSPHSGRVYPPEFIARSVIEERILRSSEDAYVDLLLTDVPDFGAHLVTTEVPRAFVDFNRAADELDPALIQGAPRSGLNPRIASGLGVLARVVANGRSIYNGKLTMDEARQRIDRHWIPFHTELGALLARQQQRFGRFLLCDVHSMPHEALSGHVSRGAPRPDVILGDRWGATCGDALMVAIESAFRDAGLRVARNAPFAGAYTLQRYGQPSQGAHAVQIEIDRALYLDEARVEPSQRFESFKETLRPVLARIAAIDPGEVSLDLAAE